MSYPGRSRDCDPKRRELVDLDEGRGWICVIIGNAVISVSSLNAAYIATHSLTSYNNIRMHG